MGGGVRDDFFILSYHCGSYDVMIEFIVYKKISLSNDGACVLKL